jgi:ribonuclease Z
VAAWGTSGIPDLWLTGCLPPRWGQRKTPFCVTGPVGAKNLMSKLEEAYALDIKIRMEDEKVPFDGIRADVTEFDRDGVVYEKDGLRVIAFEVDHGDVIKPAYGYRFEYQGRVAVLSGDTRYHPNVVKYGQGADLLIHEVGAVDAELLNDASLKRILDHHSSPLDAGSVFAQTKPKLAAYTHLVLLGNESIRPVTIDQVVAQTRGVYAGPLVVCEDLMCFDIADSVSVRKFQSGMTG